MKIKTSSLLLKALSEFNLVMIDRDDLGFTPEESTKICTKDCIDIARSEFNLELCDRALSNSIFRCINFTLLSPRYFFGRLILPRNLEIPEAVTRQYYTCSTIVFKRKWKMFVSASVARDDIFGSYLFDRKLIFKRPS